MLALFFSGLAGSVKIGFLLGYFSFFRGFSADTHGMRLQRIHHCCQ